MRATTTAAITMSLVIFGYSKDEGGAEDAAAGDSAAERWRSTCSASPPSAI